MRSGYWLVGAVAQRVLAASGGDTGIVDGVDAGCVIVAGVHVGEPCFCGVVEF